MAVERRDERSSASQTRSRIDVLNIFKTTIVLILIVNVKTISSENVTNTTKANDIASKMRIIEKSLGRAFFSDVYQNGTFRTGNSLWDNILNKCTKSPSVSCLQKNVYSYLDDSLNFDGDVNLASGMSFKKNNVDVNKYSKEANVIYLTGSKEEEARAQDEENEINDEEEPESPFEEVTDALYDKGVKFLLTHDMKLTLPDMLFDGAVLKVSPRALTKTGALVHIDLEPRETQGEGRLFFNKIKKHIRKKLITAAIAIVLVIKLIALKLVFVLPLIMGVTTAKKIFLKLLLFLFPALSHIFKLCSWYHNNYHTTKFHHHHHLITHHHKNPHAPIYHAPHGPHGPHGSTIVVRPHAAGPPNSHDLHGEHGAPGYEHYPQDWELSGPGLGSEYIAADIHRNAIANFKPHPNDMNDIKSWGLGLPPGSSGNVGEYAANTASNVNVASPPNGQRISLGAGRPVGPPGYRNKKITTKDPLQAEKEALIRAAALAARAPPSPVRDELLRVSAAKLSETNRVKTETELVRQQQEILAAQDPDTIAAEKFYGQLLDKVDHILSPLGATEPGCKERAVCALYRDPFKHTPYSNLVSNELSKDSNELVPPADSKLAIHYYRYVQAARDGQEQKECSIIYPDCHIDYNK